MKLVMVEWDDAYSDGGWLSYEKELNVSKCVTVGLLQFDEPNRVVVIQSRSNSTGNYSDRLAIPRGCIKRIRYLKVK